VEPFSIFIRVNAAYRSSVIVIRGRPYKTFAVRREAEFVQCGHFADKGGGGLLQMRTFALFGPKKFGIFEIFGVRTNKGGGGLRHCGHFADKEGQFFSILCGRLLWTAPNEKEVPVVSTIFRCFSTYL